MQEKMSDPCLPEIPFKVTASPDGTHLIGFAGDTNHMFDARTKHETSFEDSTSLGYYNQQWLQRWRNKMADRHGDMMQRMITVYYGLWPEKCPEYELYERTTSHFKKIEELFAKRLELVKKLNLIHHLPKLTEKYDGHFKELRKVSDYLVEPIYEFMRSYEALEHFLMHPVDSELNRQVKDFCDDFRKHATLAEEEMRETDKDKDKDKDKEAIGGDKESEKEGKGVV